MSESTSISEASEERRSQAGEIPLHALLGLTWAYPEKGSQHAEVVMPVLPPAFGFTANLHGGAIATMVDLACALAAARATDFDPEKESLVTADMHIRYLGRPTTDQVVAKADVVRIGSQLIVIECKVYDEVDHIIAAADFSMMRVPVRHSLLSQQSNSQDRTQDIRDGE
ncbi:MAG: PaaI family thioesterase [Microthrixaceae bacterium]